MSNNEFTRNTINKYTDYMITSQRFQSPPYDWSDGIFQRFKPISGDFPIGNNFFGNLECVNNQSGRGFYANPCGYWDNTNRQFNPGLTLKNDYKLNLVGSLFPVGKLSNDIMINPNDNVIFGYTRIGEEIRNK